MTRFACFAATVAALVAVLAGCGSSSPSASSVVDKLNALYPVGDQRDNTGACSGQGGCEQLVTTDAVSVYEWPDEQTARRFAGGRADVDVVGPFALSYAGSEQGSTSVEARRAYADEVRRLLAG